MSERDEMRKRYLAMKAELPKMPEPMEYRSGCKVSWYTFRTMKEAKIAAQHAELDASYKAHLGYDFGWLWPGEIHKDHSRRRYTVTFP
jgi:hypothetical protein